MRSTASLATVLASSFSARSSLTLLVALATGHRARMPATGSISSRSGPAGSAPARLGHAGPAATRCVASTSPSRPVRTSSVPWRPETCSRVSPAR